jgi:hypothetical protein
MTEPLNEAEEESRLWDEYKAASAALLGAKREWESKESADLCRAYNAASSAYLAAKRAWEASGVVSSEAMTPAAKRAWCTKKAAELLFEAERLESALEGAADE